MDYTPKYIIVHHSAAVGPVPQFDAINDWHKARGFAVSMAGYYVGYHRVIEPDGTVRQARLDKERDCDALGHNFDSLSVCLVGNLDAYKPTAEQIAALAALLSEWCEKYNLNAEDIFPHRHFAPKTCYGSKLPDNWASYVYLRYEVDRLKAEIESLKPTA